MAEIGGGYAVELFADQDAVDADAVVALWSRERALAADEARRRVGEVLAVATGPHREPVGVSTAFLRRNARLRMDLWYSRVFVAAPSRTNHIALSLARVGRDHLEERFVSGRDTRGAGILYEVESEVLKRIADAVWPRLDFTFVGENERGDHVRVHYFPGALAPAPPAA